jgi:hypothetical protein
MAEIDGLAVHEWATPNDAVKAASLALADRRLGNTSLPKRAVEPDPIDSVLGALPNEVDGHVGVGSHNNAVDGFRNGAEVWVARGTFGFAGVRIDREDLVPGVAQLAVNGVGWLPRVSGYAGDSDALAAEKLGNGLG